MALQGNLSTMPLPDLLQWLGSAGKTGTLVLERHKSKKSIVVRDGRIVACASDEPSDMLGHFLVSRGRLSEADLRRALSRQGDEKRHLGRILVSMGVITEDELTRTLEAKTEETIFGLFEWPDATFRYADGEVGETPFPVEMRVEDILLRGAQRYDEVMRIRAVFDDPGIVLAGTGKVPPPEVLRNRMAKRIFESIDGNKTVAEILVLSHGSEYLVTKFLFELHRAGIVEIVAVRHETAPPVPVEETVALAAGSGALPPSVDLAVADFEELLGDVPAVPPGAPPPPPVPEAPPDPALGTDLEVARRLMARGDFDAALEILNANYKSHPGSDSLRRLLAEAEAAFIDKAYRYYLPATKTIVLTRPVEALTEEKLSPAEFFLLSRIDGTWDVRSIIQITPLREIEVLRALKRMRERGWVELKDPA